MAVSGSFSEEWASRIPHGAFLDGVAASSRSSRRVTVDGHDVVYVPDSTGEILIAYEGSTFVMVVTRKDDRATAEQVMAGLLHNLGTPPVSIRA